MGNMMQSNEYPPYVVPYLELVPDGPITDILRIQAEEVKNFFTAVPLEKESYRYAEGKWSIKEVLGHMMDTERIFAYRAICFSRGEEQSLPGFDENAYIAASNYNDRSLYDLIQEFLTIRAATVSLFSGISPAMLVKKGLANNNTFSVRALAYTIAGHAMHHMNIVSQRYLSEEAGATGQ